MLVIWHMNDWMKEIFGSAMSMVGWYMEVANLVGSYLCLMKAKLSCFLIGKCAGYYVNIIFVILCLFIGYNNGYMNVFIHGYFHVFTCN